MRKVILAIDIGNTNITSGVFSGRRLLVKGKMTTHKYSAYAKCVKSLLTKAEKKHSDIELVLISSVVPLALARLVVVLNRIFAHKIRIIGKDAKVPIRNLYAVKSEVGQDRLVNAFAVKKIYGTPCVVVDFGTAITFDMVSAKGDYLGGLILPGIEMSLSSLHNKTALLPRVELKEAKEIIGKDTVNSIRGGILFGLGAMCDGLAAKYRNMFGSSMKVVATGGNAGLVKNYAGSIEIVDEDLTLKGISLIAESIK